MRQSEPGASAPARRESVPTEAEVKAKIGGYITLVSGLDLHGMEMTVLYLTEQVVLVLDLNEQKNEYVRQ